MERFSDFAIEAWAPGNVTTLCAFVEAAFALGETRRIPCQKGTVGGRVKIVLRSKEMNPLCEVQVFGVRSKSFLISMIIFIYMKQHVMTNNSSIVW